MTNPLLSDFTLPPFSQISPNDVEPAVDNILEDNRAKIDTLLKDNQTFTWESLIRPLDDMGDKLDKAWSPVSHMNSVVNTKELRDAYNNCLSKLSLYESEINQNEKLYHAFSEIFKTNSGVLDSAQRKYLEDSLRDFRLSGVHLNEKDKKTFKDLQEKLTKLTSHFEENVLDCTDEWSYHIEDKAELDGLPEHAIEAASTKAKDREIKGFLLDLTFPSFFAVMTYAKDRALRETFYEAYITRASEKGSHDKKYDNSANMQEILKVRKELAALLDFEDYVTYSLQTKMAKSKDEVLDFLNELVVRSKPQALKEYEALKAFAKDEDNIELEPWDIGYYSEKMRQSMFDISQEMLRPYFEANHVLKGMFEIVQKLYGIKIIEKKEFDTWHKDVRFFEITDEKDTLRGKLFVDLYARQHKRSGAWMDECVNRRKLDESNIQHPVAFLTCNFTPPDKNGLSLFTHDEVITLFHEFGHCLHHLLTQIDYPGVSGIHGVPWDAVELPSQFFENWCWQQEGLDLISRHHKTKEKIPKTLFDKLNAAKNFQSAMQMVRQLEFSIFDFKVHLAVDENGQFPIQKILDEVREAVSVVKVPEFNRFAHSFSHIFAGGYAAGYYSYKWAEVLSSDAFSLFEEKGIFDKDTGRKFLHNILEKGGSEKPDILFKAFRGRPPKIDALLKQNGIDV